MIQNWDFLLAEIWGLLLFVLLLTLFACWFLWGREAVRANVRKLEAAEADLSKARTMLTQSRAEIQRAERKQEELKDRLAREQAKLAEALTVEVEDVPPTAMTAASEKVKAVMEKYKSHDYDVAGKVDRFKDASVRFGDKLWSFIDRR